MGPGDCRHTAGGDEWLCEEFRQVPKLPLRFFLSAGRLEPERLRVSNRRLAETLDELGYPVVSREFMGGHDCAFHPNMLAEGLSVLTAPDQA